jgi:hypothetical protein
MKPLVLGCIAILNNQKCDFFLLFLYKIGEQRAELVLSAEGTSRRGETVKEDEYDANTVYTCV